MQANVSYNVNSSSTKTCEPQDNLVYFTIADDHTTSSFSSVPPQLPPERTPYYQEIQSDQTVADYETPIKSKFLPELDLREEGEDSCT